jgi:outer membrane protein OmpA-like peptidoglycan-associated protein
VASTPVRWVKLRLVGGIHILTEQSFFEFSEIIGYGAQETPALVDDFQGVWKGRGVLIELKQEGATVTGCYDANAELTGTVTGNILRARGIAPDDSVMSLFILSVVGDGLLRGVRSTNGAPFRLYTGPPAPEGTTTDCSEIPEPALGCGSVIHGINFDFDAAAIRPDSEPVLAELFEGLQADPGAAIVIEGHTSSEGSTAYNQDLSARRAQSVVEDLVRRGLEAGRITARGRGEDDPIAGNDDESGRSLNRRVEVMCRF